MLEANSQVAALKASEIQYAKNWLDLVISIEDVDGLRRGQISCGGGLPIILATPHLRPRKGIGSRSRFVHRALPDAKADSCCETLNRGLEKRIFIKWSGANGSTGSMKGMGLKMEEAHFEPQIGMSNWN